MDISKIVLIFGISLLIYFNFLNLFPEIMGWIKSSLFIKISYPSFSKKGIFNLIFFEKISLKKVTITTIYFFIINLSNERHYI